MLWFKFDEDLRGSRCGLGDFEIKFGRRLRKLREKRGWSQVEAAHSFGIDRGHLSDLERGKKSVCLPMLKVLSKGFNVTVSELMRGV